MITSTNHNEDLPPDKQKHFSDPRIPSIIIMDEGGLRFNGGMLDALLFLIHHVDNFLMLPQIK